MADIKRLNLTFTMSQPVQRKAWQTLATVPVGKRADWVCRLIAEQNDARRRRRLLNDIRKIVQEELRSCNMQPKEIVNSEPEPQSVSDDVLGFLRSLQEGDDIG